MERGTDWERQAVRGRWEALDARRAAADQFVRGLVATFAGVSLLLLASAGRVCGFTLGGATSGCVSMLSLPATFVLGVVGAFAVVVGTRWCLTARPE